MINYLGNSIEIVAQVSGGEIDLYLQVLIYDSSLILLSTNNMIHKADGLYSFNWTPSLKGDYSFQYKVYTDAGHTLLSAEYGIESEKIFIIDLVDYKTNVSALATELNATANTASINNNVSLVEGKVNTVVGKLPIGIISDFDNITETVNLSTVTESQIDSIEVDTNEIQGKLPNNNIMGAGVKTDKDDEIDAIKAKTDNLPLDPASETNAMNNANLVIDSLKNRGRNFNTTGF